MEEENNYEYVETGNGNMGLANVCEGLFYKTGNPAMYSMSQRLKEPAYEFDQNFDQQTFDMGLQQ